MGNWGMQNTNKTSMEHWKERSMKYHEKDENKMQKNKRLEEIIDSVKGSELHYLEKYRKRSRKR